MIRNGTSKQIMISDYYHLSRAHQRIHLGKPSWNLGAVRQWLRAESRLYRYWKPYGESKRWARKCLGCLWMPNISLEVRCDYGRLCWRGRTRFRPLRRDLELPRWLARNGFEKSRRRWITKYRRMKLRRRALPCFLTSSPLSHVRTVSKSSHASDV